MATRDAAFGKRVVVVEVSFSMAHLELALQFELQVLFNEIKMRGTDKLYGQLR